MNANSKTALVTGAGKRIGAEIARHLASRGWQVIIHYNHSAAAAEALAHEINGNNGRAMVSGQDLEASERLESWFAETAGKSGPIGLLVHNASLFLKDNLQNLEAKQAEKQWRVNGLAPLLLSKAFAKQCAGDGNIICLLDGMKGWSYSANYLSYALSKRMVEESIVLLAEELAPSIRINGIALGATLPGVDDKPTTFDKLRNLVPLKRNSSPAEVCATLQFLLEAKSMTGQVLDISGGMSILRHFTSLPSSGSK